MTPEKKQKQPRISRRAEWPQPIGDQKFYLRRQRRAFRSSLFAFRESGECQGILIPWGKIVHKKQENRTKYYRFHGWILSGWSQGWNLCNPCNPWLVFHGQCFIVGAAMTFREKRRANSEKPSHLFGIRPSVVDAGKVLDRLFRCRRHTVIRKRVFTAKHDGGMQ